MNFWSEYITRMLTWRGAVPRPLHLQGIYVHVSTLLALPLLSLAIACIPMFTSLDGRWSVAAITVPIIWIGSLAVRIGLQWMAIGAQSEFELVVGPTGNISQGYERLSGANMMSFAVAGQSGTLVMVVIGGLLLGASPSSPGLTLASLLDFQTGWHGTAWASQLLWVNAFLFFMHLWPASPLDARALYVGWRHISRPGISPAEIHRSVANIDSHVGTAAASFSLAMIITRLMANEPIGVWHFLFTISIYMLIASHIEAYQAQQEEELLEPPAPRRRQRTQLASYTDSSFSKFSDFDEDSLDMPSAHEVLDVDEILRKLHREGQDALSAFEKEALLSASRELKARRQSRS